MTVKTETDPVLRELDHLREAMATRDAALDARLVAMAEQSGREHAEALQRITALERTDLTIEAQHAQIRAWAKCAAGLIASSAALGSVLTVLVGLLR